MVEIYTMLITINQVTYSKPVTKAQTIRFFVRKLSDTDVLANYKYLKSGVFNPDGSAQVTPFVIETGFEEDAVVWIRTECGGQGYFKTYSLPPEPPCMTFVMESDIMLRVTHKWVQNADQYSVCLYTSAHNASIDLPGVCLVSNDGTTNTQWFVVTPGQQLWFRFRYEINGQVSETCPVATYTVPQ